MNIVFHGLNAAIFRDGIEPLLTARHSIAVLPDVLSTDEARRLYQSADVIVGIKLDETLPPLNKLRLFQAPAAGTDAIDCNLLPSGAVLCNAFGHEIPIAEYVMAALLERHVPLSDADNRLRKGDWHYWAGRPTGLRTELSQQSIGLLGFGHIGKAIATLAKAFGMRVVVANRTQISTGSFVDQSFGLDGLVPFMALADAIVVCLPHTPETTGIVNRDALAAMRRHAVILNVGRGPVIDEAALFEALQHQWIAGAVIDTWYQYPSPTHPTPLPSRYPFETLPNVTMTPHMSGWTRGTIERRRRTVADNINRLTAADPLMNQVYAA